MTEVQINSYGWNVDLTLKDGIGNPIDLSLATSMQFIFRDPAGKTFSVNAVYVVDGVNGQLRYSVQNNDLSVVGIWKVQAHVLFEDAELWSTPIEFEVKGNLISS